MSINELCISIVLVPQGSYFFLGFLLKWNTRWPIT